MPSLNALDMGLALPQPIVLDYVDSSCDPLTVRSSELGIGHRGGLGGVEGGVGQRTVVEI